MAVLIQFTPNNNQNVYEYKACMFVSHELKKEYHDRHTVPAVHDIARLMLAPCFLLNIPMLVRENSIYVVVTN